MKRSITESPTSRGIGEALKIAFDPPLNDTAQVQRMKSLVEKLRGIEGRGGNGTQR